MSYGRSTAIAAAVVGAFALGVYTGPYMTHRAASDTATVMPMSSPAPAPAATDRQLKRPRPAATSGMATSDRTTAFRPMKTSMAVSAPDLQRRLKPLLNTGANMDVAAEGFYSAEQFATVAHASQNTSVPFMLLKHRVLTEGDTLVAAIRKSKPDLDAVIEVDRARAEARSDLAQLE